MSRQKEYRKDLDLDRLPEDVSRDIESIASSEGISKEEALRKALEFFSEKRKKTELKRISVSLSEPISKLLELLSMHEGTSQSEVVRKSITIYGFLLREIEAGGHIAIHQENGEVKELVFT